MTTIKFTGITANESMTHFEAYKSFFDRKVGDSVQTGSGEWHKIIFQTTDYETALTAISELRKMFNRIAARKRAQQRKIENAHFVNFLTQHIDRQILIDAGILKR